MDFPVSALMSSNKAENTLDLLYAQAQGAITELKLATALITNSSRFAMACLIEDDLDSSILEN